MLIEYIEVNDDVFSSMYEFAGFRIFDIDDNGIITNKAVMEALDGLPPVKVHCSLLAEEAIHAALWDYAQKNSITIEGLEKPVNDIEEKIDDEEY